MKVTHLCDRRLSKSRGFDDFSRGVMAKIAGANDVAFEDFCAEQDRIAPTMDLQVSRETLRQSLAHMAPVSPRKAD